MKLGDGMFVVRLCRSLDESFEFYSKIGYKVLKKPTKGDSSFLFSDGRMNLLLKEDKSSSEKIEVQYFNPKLDDLIHELELAKISFKKFEEQSDTPHSIKLTDPNGFEVFVQEMMYNQEFKIDPRGDSLIEHGNFGELAIPTEDYSKTAEFWKMIGFEPLVEESNPYPWGIFTDGLVVLGIHQAPDFDVPSLTYFKPNMLESITQLQKAGLKFTESKMALLKDGNGITRAPDGQQLFFFEGDIK